MFLNTRQFAKSSYQAGILSTAFLFRENFII